VREGKTTETDRKTNRKKSDDKADEGNGEPPKKRQRKKAVVAYSEGPRRASRLRIEEPGKTARSTRSA
jgi:hypothetical protein